MLTRANSDHTNDKAANTMFDKTPISLEAEFLTACFRWCNVNKK